jgi:hypothetical protein
MSAVDRVIKQLEEKLEKAYSKGDSSEISRLERKLNDAKSYQ